MGGRIWADVLQNTVLEQTKRSWLKYIPYPVIKLKNNFKFNFCFEKGKEYNICCYAVLRFVSWCLHISTRFLGHVFFCHCLSSNCICHRTKRLITKVKIKMDLCKLTLLVQSNAIQQKNSRTLISFNSHTYICFYKFYDFKFCQVSTFQHTSALIL